MRIGIDFDDVVADSLTMVIRMHNERYGTKLTRKDFHTNKYEEVWGGTLEEAIKKVNEFLDEDQLREIGPIKGVAEGIRILKEQGHELYIITGRAERDVEQTERWIEYHFAGVFKGVHFAHFFTLNKNTVARRKSDICEELEIELLIDDNLPTALECAEKGIKMFLFDTEWNVYDPLPSGVTRVHSWDDIIKKLSHAK